MYHDKYYKVYSYYEYKTKEEMKDMEAKEEIIDKGDKEVVEIREIQAGKDFEIDIPDSVLAILHANPDKDKIQFIEENGKVYIEKA